MNASPSLMNCLFYLAERSAGLASLSNLLISISYDTEHICFNLRADIYDINNGILREELF